jgi:hypothetical protein
MVHPGGMSDGLASLIVGKRLDQLSEPFRSLDLALPPRPAEPANSRGHDRLCYWSPAPSRWATKSTAWPTVSIFAASCSEMLSP